MSSGSDKRQRQLALRVRLSETEHSALSEAADRAGLSLAGYARSLLLAAEPLRQSRRPPATKAELAMILGHLGKVGSNVNQIARASNSETIIAASELVAASEAILAMRDAIMVALGRVP